MMWFITTHPVLGLGEGLVPDQQGDTYNTRVCITQRQIEIFPLDIIHLTNDSLTNWLYKVLDILKGAEWRECNCHMRVGLFAIFFQII